MNPRPLAPRRPPFVPFRPPANPILDAVKDYFIHGDRSYLEEHGLLFLVEDEEIGVDSEFDEIIEDSLVVKKRRKKNVFDYDEGKKLNFDYYINRRAVFREVFRMDYGCFKKMMEHIHKVTDVFSRKTDALSKQGIHPEIKLLACLNVLTSGTSLAQVADRFKFGRQTLNYYFDEFLKQVPKALAEYAKFPSSAEAKKIERKHRERHKLPGILGSLDCLHWQWDQCRMAEAYAYSGKSGKPSLVLDR